jgi:arylsulfatase A-like enzyme
MGELFNYLDVKVGKGSYTVFLTADHGAAYNSNFLIDNKLPAGFWNSGAVLRDLNALLEEKYKEKNVVTSFSNMQVHLNNRQIATGKLDEEGIRKDIVTFLKKAPNVAFVVDMQKTNETQLPGELQTRLSNGYNYKRSGPITIVLEPGWYSGSPTSTGTTHGSWNPYDAHIPLVWMGWGIKQGATNKPTNMSDIAPTLAGLLRIQTPNGSIGKPIEEVYKR